MASQDAKGTPSDAALDRELAAARAAPVETARAAIAAAADLPRDDRLRALRLAKVLADEHKRSAQTEVCVLVQGVVERWRAAGWASSDVATALRAVRNAVNSDVVHALDMRSLAAASTREIAAREAWGMLVDAISALHTSAIADPRDYSVVDEFEKAPRNSSGGAPEIDQTPDGGAPNGGEAASATTTEGREPWWR